ncbi:protein-disulfide reductase DsbD N-terminal domain-containing protein [Terriglobus sp. RCC_193]|uniref:protein-disulfide reductase DsbD N-terminal domain-containing protein n=1 Tax=Terriglobus sp. RCC_193 TaxID=3239218 RepID=UPI0035267AB4
MNKVLSALTLLLISAVGAAAQRPGNVQWSASAKPAAHAGDYVVVLHAEVENGWHVYSAKQSPGGPLPLVIRVEQGTPFSLDGAITGSNPVQHHDASFNLDTEYFMGTFLLNVPVKSTTQGSGEIPLAVRFQMCSDTTCMPPRTIHLVAKVNAS